MDYRFSFFPRHPATWVGFRGAGRLGAGAVAAAAARAARAASPAPAGAGSARGAPEPRAARLAAERLAAAAGAKGAAEGAAEGAVLEIQDVFLGKGGYKVTGWVEDEHMSIHVGGCAFALRVSWYVFVFL